MAQDDLERLQRVIARAWGKLVVAIDGIRAKQKMPIFRDHRRDEIVGYSTKAWSDSCFWVAGIFSKVTETAKEVKALAEENYPWQASIGVKPLNVVELERGKSMNVNNRQISGPAEVWTESEVYETSFVSLGADSDTSATIFSRGTGAPFKKCTEAELVIREIVEECRGRR
ncbi:MAG: hypothetical protein AB1461_15320 [Thermodesulfobacteriota bacterium]